MMSYCVADTITVDWEVTVEDVAILPDAANVSSTLAKVTLVN